MGTGQQLGLRPAGAPLKTKYQKSLVEIFVQERDDVVPFDSAIIMNPKVWEASGHLQNFSDQLVECKVATIVFRIDHLLEAKGIKPKYDKEVIQLPAEVKCPDCDGNLTEPKSFNLMFKTFIGTTEDSTTTAYLRPETAGGMFVNFRMF